VTGVTTGGVVGNCNYSVCPQAYKLLSIEGYWTRGYLQKTLSHGSLGFVEG